MRAKFTALYDGLKIDSEDGVILRNGESISISPKELAVLCLLMSESGRLVDKARILDEVWGVAHVGDGSLMRCISSLRKRLADYSPNTANAIKTEFGRGYRFVGEITSSQMGGCPERKIGWRRLFKPILFP